MTTQTVIQRSGEIETKRLYLDVSLDFKCQHCGTTCTLDLNVDYLSYPDIGVFETGTVCCESCGGDTEYKLRIKSISTEIEYE